MAIKSVSELQYSVAPSNYGDLTLVNKKWVEDQFVSGAGLYNIVQTIASNAANAVSVTVDNKTIKSGESGLYVVATGGLKTGNNGVEINLATDSGLSTTNGLAVGYGSGLTLDTSSPKKLIVDAVDTGGTDAAKGKIVKLKSTATTIDTTLLPASALVGNTVTTVAAGDDNITIGGTGHDYTVAIDTTTLKTSLGLDSAAYLAAGTSGNNVLQLSDGKIPTGVLPDLAITNVFTANSTTNSGNGLISSSNTSYSTTKPRQGDICVVTVNGVASAYILTADTVDDSGNPTAYTNINNWTKLAMPAASIASITGTATDSVAAVNAIIINNAKTTASAITINDAKADGSTKGIAAFNSTRFKDSNGVIDLKETYLTTTAATSGYQAKIDTANANGKVLSYNGSGFAWVDQTTAYSLPVATADALGGVSIAAASAINNDSGAVDVKVDGTTITKDSSTGNLQVKSGVYTPVITQHSTSSDYTKGTVVCSEGVLYQAANDIGAGTAISHTNWTAITFKCGSGLVVDPVYRNNGAGSFYGATLKVDTAVSNTISTDGETTTYTAAGKIPKLTSTGTIGPTLLPSGTTSAKGIVQLTNTVAARSNVLTYAVTPKGVSDYAVANVPYLKWASGVSYTTDTLVYYDGAIYQCKANHTSEASGAKGAPTATGTTYWRPYSRYTGEHSGPTTGTSTYIEIPHNLNTQDIVVQVYKIESDGKHPVLVDFTFGTTSGTQSDTIKDNNITLQFATGQSNSDTYRVVILAAR